MSLINYSFYIACDENGKQEPFIRIGSHADLIHLSHLAFGHMSKSKGVKHELKEIEAVLKANKKTHSFGGDDWCIVELRKKKAIVMNGFDEFEPFEIDTKGIVNLLERWHEFLVKYENGQIPGIIPENKKDEWIIVPKTDEDE